MTVTKHATHSFPNNQADYLSDKLYDISGDKLHDISGNKLHDISGNKLHDISGDKLHDISGNTERNGHGIIKLNDSKKITCPLNGVNHYFY